MKENNIILEAKGIKKSFAGVHALKGVNLQIKAGKVHCLAGENGCGKSTLIKIISGVYSLDEGEVIIDGQTYNGVTPMIAIKHGIQVIYQDFSVFPYLTVQENIASPYFVSKGKKIVNYKEIKKLAKAQLDKLNVDIPLGQTVENLSVAEKQIIEISRALAQDAKIIIMDEPTTALTSKEVKTLLSVVRELCNRGIAVVFVSHKTEEVFSFADEVTIFRNGENVISNEISYFDRKNFSVYLTGKEIETRTFSGNVDKNVEVLRVHNLNKKNVFENVSFSLNKGEVLGITGLLGSGKTEITEAIFGLRSIDSGEIYIKGEKVNIDNAQTAIKHKLAFVPEDRLTQGLFFPQSISKNLIASSQENCVSKGGFINWKYVKEIANQQAVKLKLKTASVEMPVSSMSGGNQQRVLIGKWLNTNPEIIMFNGPTVGVDIGSKDEIYNIISELSHKGITSIIVSDDLSEICSNCNRVLITKSGKIVSEIDQDMINEGEIAKLLSDIN